MHQKNIKTDSKTENKTMSRMNIQINLLGILIFMASLTICICTIILIWKM
jgi:hypothetical protein